MRSADSNSASTHSPYPPHSPNPPLMHRARLRPAPRERLDLEQLDEAAAPLEDAVALEQRLTFERLEREVLRQRVDQVFVGDGRRKLRIAAAALDRRRQQRFEP